MLLINDAEVRQVLAMDYCIEAMGCAVAEESKGVAVSAPRTRYKVQPDLEQAGYMATIIPGAVPSCAVASMRYASTIVQERVVGGVKRMNFLSPSKRNWDFVMLFSLQTGEPLALIADYSLSAIRVGATTGVVPRVSEEDCESRRNFWLGPSSPCQSASHCHGPRYRVGESLQQHSSKPRPLRARDDSDVKC